MNSNLDHDVFKKKSQSIKLAQKVEGFLKENGLEQPVQIPFGVSSKPKDEFNPSVKYTAQDTMRKIMSNSVAEDRDKKSKNKFNSSDPKLISVHSRIDFNRSAREKAFIANEMEFTGICNKSIHGKTTFRMKSDGSEHYCKLCKKEGSAKWNETFRNKKKAGMV